jgi:hypothetical protein
LKTSIFEHDLEITLKRRIKFRFEFELAIHIVIIKPDGALFEEIVRNFQKSHFLGATKGKNFNTYFLLCFPE